MAKPKITKPAPKGGTKPKPGSKGAKPKPGSKKPVKPVKGAKTTTTSGKIQPLGWVAIALAVLLLIVGAALASNAFGVRDSLLKGIQTAPAAGNGPWGPAQPQQPAAGGGQQQAAATATVPPAQATVAPVNGQPMTVAGGDFFARGVEDLGNGWMRIREAGNRDLCAWSTQFKLEYKGGIAAQVPHCLEFRFTGNGSVVFTAKPDTAGYDTSDTLKTGLAFWPSGNNGSYRVMRAGKWTEWVALSTGPEGVKFAKDGGEVTIEFRLENGFVTMPAGETRNNVQPRY